MYWLVEESQKQLICQESFPAMVMRFLEPTMSPRKSAQVKQLCLELLLSLTESEIGRKYIATHFNVNKYAFLSANLPFSEEQTL